MKLLRSIFFLLWGFFPLSLYASALSRTDRELIDAVYDKHLYRVEGLLNNRLDLSVLSEDGYTLLHLALLPPEPTQGFAQPSYSVSFEERRRRIVNKLLLLNAEYLNSETPEKAFDINKEYSFSPDLHVTEGGTALSIAIESFEMALVKALVEQGADVHHPSVDRALAKLTLDIYSGNNNFPEGSISGYIRDKRGARRFVYFF